MHLDTGWILAWMADYKYAAMATILLLCGVGLPLPEEVTLLASGLMVGWRQADFLLASLACSFGILAGDSLIFAAGRHFGQRFFSSRPVSFLLSPSRKSRVKSFFEQRGSSALFLARFFPGIRIGVYAYAGAERVPWSRFLLLDGLGVGISAPLSIWLGQKAGRLFADDPEQAIAVARHQARAMGIWLIVGMVLVVVVLGLARALFRRLGPR